MRMLIAGGGTGGHLFPGMALAEELMSRTLGNEVSFVGTQRGLEARVVPQQGFRLDMLPVLPLRGQGFRGFIRGLLALPKALLESMRILRMRRPDVVVGVGGYASGPVVLAAWLLRIRRVICEQNTVPGTTNRILGRIADAVFVSFEESTGYFPRRRALLLGNPVRKALFDNYLKSNAPHSAFTILAFGGSQGAHALNVAVADAFEAMGARREGIHLIHQTGRADMAEIKERYARMGFNATVSEFIDDMATAYSHSEIIICRAGATSVAELGVCRKPSILVPFPFASDDHQTRNALAMERAGASILIRQSDLNGEMLAKTILDLKADPERLHAMELAAGVIGRPEAAKECVNWCFELVAKGGGSVQR
jgi:UDP-N-acetylglucosamine--N-acetylmuramyl-(pentapeptide) pyrophosphoryl-undecaprenol N-acetylglucosamine transferase